MAEQFIAEVKTEQSAVRDQRTDCDCDRRLLGLPIISKAPAWDACTPLVRESRRAFREKRPLDEQHRPYLKLSASAVAITVTSISTSSGSGGGGGACFYVLGRFCLEEIVPSCSTPALR